MGRSAEYQAADFARITAVRPLDSAPSGPAPTWSPEQRQDAADQFAASRLAQPSLISDLDTSPYTQWVQVDGEVSGYRPGSTLHLAVTSEPVVLASVMVGRDGTASISAVVPIELLGIGEHRIRFVGTRVFDGLSVDDDGEIQLPAAVLEQIDRCASCRSTRSRRGGRCWSSCSPVHSGCVLVDVASSSRRCARPRRQERSSLRRSRLCEYGRTNSRTWMTSSMMISFSERVRFAGGDR